MASWRERRGVSFCRPDEQGRNEARAVAWSLVPIATILLTSGTLFYLAFRTSRPAILERLPLPPLHMAAVVQTSALAASLPSLLHVTAFGLLTSACLRPGIRSALGASAAWAGVGVLWEFACADRQAWLRLGGELIGAASVPVCTYDNGDIVASVAGVAVTVVIAAVVRKFTLDR